MKRSYIIPVLLLTAALLSGCGEKIKPGEQKVQRLAIEGITVFRVKSELITQFYRTSGTVRSWDTAVVSARVIGVVDEIKVHNGQRVRKGDVLLTISSPDIAAKVQAAKEAVEEAKRGVMMAAQNRRLMEKTFERFKMLYEGKAVTEQEFDEIRTKRDVAVLNHEMAGKSLGRAEAGLREAGAFMDYTVITSPINGVVAEKKIETGSMASPGMPLIIMESERYRVEAPINESLLGRLRSGAEVEVFIESLKQRINGRVSEVVRQVDPMTRTFIVKITVEGDKDKLRGGLYSDIRIPVGESPVLLVPSQAVIRRGQLEGVFVVDAEGVLSLRYIRTGREVDGRIEVLSGLNDGEMIVAGGIEKAVDGARVSL